MCQHVGKDYTNLAGCFLKVYSGYFLKFWFTENNYRQFPKKKQTRIMPWDELWSKYDRFAWYEFWMHTITDVLNRLSELIIIEF